jgi:5-methylcytosine-specific restriction protein A
VKARARDREMFRPTPSQRGYGAEWRSIRKLALHRDRYQCQRCGWTGDQRNPLTVDHVIAKSRGGSDDLANMQTLCKRCHGVKTGRDQRNAVAKF